MDGYEVDPATLTSAAGTLRTVADGAGAAITALDRLDGDLGPGGLRERLNELAAGWRNDVRAVRAEIESAAAAAGAAARGYRAGDELSRRDLIGRSQSANDPSTVDPRGRPPWT